MILAVKKPDYLGSSKWDMRHGKRAISVRINDEVFLQQFQDRKIDVRPKDALKCMVQVEMKYGNDNVNRPGFTGGCLVLLRRLYRQRSCLHRMPPQLLRVGCIRCVPEGGDC